MKSGGKIYLFVFFVTLLASCLDKSNTRIDENKESLLDKKLFPIDSISIPIDSVTSVQKYLQLVSLSDKEYLVSYQPNVSVSNNFHFYSLQERSKDFTLSFDEAGPNGVGKISPFVTFISLDSILVSEINANRIYLLDSSGTVKDKYDLNNRSIKGTIYPMATYPLTILNGYLYSFQMNSFNSNTGKFSLQAYPEFIYNIASGQSKSDPLQYPEYPDHFYSSVEVWKASRCFGFTGERIYSFAFDNQLFVIKDQKVKSFNILNDDFNQVNISSFDIRHDDMRAQMKLVSETGLYLSLIPDPYQEVYYRVFLMPGQFMDADGKFYMLAERPFKIQIIDHNFRLIGETAFESRKFNPYRILVSKSGLLIEVGNPYDPISEDQFTFKVFKIDRDES